MTGKPPAIQSSAISVLAVASLSAQTPPARAAAPPAGTKIRRAADGHPDLTGIWSNATRTPFERPDSFGGKASLTDDEPAHGTNTRRSVGKKCQRVRRPNVVGGDFKTLPDDTRCLVGNTPAVPMTPALYNNNYEIVQPPARSAWCWKWCMTAASYMNGKHHT